MPQARAANGRFRSLLIVLAAMALAGCQTTESEGPAAAQPGATAVAAAAPVEEEPMTRARASGECWMKLEKTRPGGSLEHRASIVEKCIAEKLNAAEQAQIVPQPKPKPKQ